MKTREIINHTKQLVAIRSTSDNPQALKEAVDYVANLVDACNGVTIERFEQNGKPSFLAYRGKTRPEKFDILLNAHLDVVPAKDEQFTATEKDGKLYGRGTLDMKGTAMVLTDLFCEMVNQVPYHLGLQIVSDEEVGGYDGVRLHIENGVRAEFVVMGEYANDRRTIYNAARGLCWAEIAFKGKTSHGAHLWNGSNAVVKAGEFAAAILKRYPTPDKETWTTTASIANLSTSNQAYNKVPDEAILKIDFRFTQEDPAFQDEQAVRELVASIDPSAEVVNLAVFEPAVNVEELNPYVQGLSAALRQVTKAKPRFLGRPGGSDGRHYAAINTDIIEFGLFGSGSHSDHEYVELSSFEEYQNVMRAFLDKPIPTRLKQATQEPLHQKLLNKLVAMPTPSGDFAAVNKSMAYVEHFLASRGMHVATYQYEGFRSIVATSRPGNKRPTVLLSAHIDTVPAPEAAYKLTAADGHFFGRGVMDMKSAVASYLALVDTLKDELSDYDFGIMLTSDEEVGGRNGVKRLLDEEGYAPKVVIVPDGGENWQLETFCKGVQWIKLEASGRPAHASRPWEGESAISQLLKALRSIENLSPANPEPTDTHITIGTIEGGTTANQIPASASAMLDVRSGSLADHRTIFQHIAAICEEHNVRLTRLVDDEPCVNDPNNPYIKPFTALVTKITGQAPGTCYSLGVTDGRFFSAKGIPCIIIEPPAGGRHTDNEWLSIEGFNQFCTMLEEYVRETALLSAKEDAATKQQAIRRLSQRLNAGDKPAYVWYAMYGSGLNRDNFMCLIKGGKPAAARSGYPGCTDHSEPLKDVFMSLPYAMYFAGKSSNWGGGLITLETTRDPSKHTIARAYLITVQQFEEMTAQQNARNHAEHLPLALAMRHGFTVIGDGSGEYDGLLYCGTKENIPIFTLTAAQPRYPYTAPNPVYTQLLCEGLSQDAGINAKDAVEYLLDVPGLNTAFEADQLSTFLEKPTEKQHRRHPKK